MGETNLYPSGWRGWWTLPQMMEKMKPHRNTPRFCVGVSVRIWVFPKIGVPQNRGFIMENPIKMDDLGVPLFLETPICWCVSDRFQTYRYDYVLKPVSHKKRHLFDAFNEESLTRDLVLGDLVFQVKIKIHSDTFLENITYPCPRQSLRWSFTKLGHVILP